MPITLHISDELDQNYNIFADDQPKQITLEMSLKTFVKISNVSNLSDARYCAGMMVDMIGFNVNKNSPDYVSPELFSDITSWIAGVKLVAEFGEMGNEEIKDIVNQYAIDFIESTHVDALEQLTTLNIPIIYKLNLKNEEDINSLDDHLSKVRNQVEYVVVGGTELPGESIEKRLVDMQHEYKLLRAFDNIPSHFPTISGVWYGVQLEATPEEQPGLKDYGMVMDVLELLEEE